MPSLAVQMPPVLSAATSRPGKVAAPLRPILKPTASQVLGKRKAVDDGDIRSDDSSQPADSQASSRKRQRVEFNMDLEVHEVGTRSVEEIKAEIKKALDAHARGDDEEYDILKEVLSGKHRFSDDDDDDDADLSLQAKRRQELKLYFVALTSLTPLLGRSASGLVRNVMQCQWLGRDEQFAKIYTQFLAALVSVQGSYLNLILSTLVKKFVDSRTSAWSVAEFPSVSRQEMQERLHLALQYLLQVFPAANNVLANQITSSFPYHDEPKRDHLAYVDNLLRLREYASQLNTEIMDLVVSRLVEIDVQMQMDLDDLDDGLTYMVAGALKQAEEDDDDSDTESVDSDEEEEDEFERIKAGKESIQKMDTTMDTLFRLYTPKFADPDSDDAAAAFEGLLTEFSHIILPTYKSRHTQFLIFHFGQRSERLMDAFCGTCINIAFESQRPLVLRQAASAYLASFVARGALVPGHIVRTIFEVLGYHLDQMRNLYETTCRGPDVRRYAPFYALTQALMYIFCFRWRDLVRSVPDDVDRDDPSSYLGQDIEWETDIKDILRRNIFSKLNPLKICSPAIVDQFAMLAHKLNFMYVYSIVEENKRVRLSQFAASSYSTGALRESGLDLGDESWQQLDSFFPFDPYQLPKSKHWVEHDYLQWRPIPGLSQDDDEGDSSDAGDEPLEDNEGIEEDTATDDDDAGLDD